MRSIFWISDPASPRGVEDSVSPRLDGEREPLHVDVSGGDTEAPVVFVVKVNQVEEYDDLRGSDERAFKVDAHGGGVVAGACVFTSEELQISRRKGKYMIDAAVESGVDHEFAL